jgi:RHS repeat-associated protein
MTGANGEEVIGSRAYYRPFGGFADPTHPPQTDTSGNREFTSKELDVTGLYDYGARLYDPKTGRFTQADDVNVGRSPKAQNRFSYVLNNPLGMVDPSGHTAASVLFKWYRDMHIPIAGLPANFHGDTDLQPVLNNLYTDYQPFQDAVKNIVKQIPGAHYNYVNQVPIIEPTAFEEVESPYSNLTKKGGTLTISVDVKKIEDAGTSVRALKDVVVHSVSHVEDEVRGVVRDNKDIKTLYDPFVEEPNAYATQIIYRQYIGLGVGKAFYSRSAMGKYEISADWVKSFEHYLAQPDAGEFVPMWPATKNIRPTNMYGGPLP